LEGKRQVKTLQKRNCVVIKDAGRRIDKHSVAWYDKSFRTLVDDYFNTGDIAVYDSTLKLLDYDNLYSLDIDRPVDAKVAAALNEKYEYICLRASNYIHEQMNWGYLEDWLEAVRLPVLCLGVGAQASEERRIELPPGGRRVWDAIADRAPSIGVRGAFSASVLADNGVKNVDIVGCPTIFRSLAPVLYLRHKSINDIETVAFSLRRETGANYTNNVDEFLETQKRLIVRLNRRFSLVVTAHGEIEEKIYYYNDIARLKEARGNLIDSNWFDPIFGRELEQIYAMQLFFTPVVSHYDELARSLDFTIGYRVHGILPALAMGTPGVLLRYDARSAELAETLRVPIFDPKAALTAPFEDIFDRSLFCQFEAHYPAAYQTMRDFLEKHRVANSMQEAASAAA
jgi:hypothetical protein